MRVTLWGTRGSVGRAGPQTMRYGGDTSSVEVVASDGTVLILDAGSGIVHADDHLPSYLRRIDVLLTHLHMDHIQGLGFFTPLRDPDVEVHLWGPVSTTQNLAQRLGRYLSPPLFPVRLREMPGLVLHDLAPGDFRIGPFEVAADLVIHPGPTLGYRIREGGSSVAYMPDHEPALGVRYFPEDPAWTSGYELARGVDVLIHDAQYTQREYETKVGWGHSSFPQCMAFAGLTGVKKLVTFHHEPEHTDALIDRLHDRARESGLDFDLVAGTRGAVIEV